ncbi:MAG TPA: serine/threonine-protein kinase [Streptosporangiaceae bacterium]|nr:serine/threonine-protein kinase [Streptosporangiaceae bacterium]
MPSLDRIPGRLGPYRLLERIGEGGMGVVHLASDRRGRLVAIKVLHPRGMEEPNARRRLAREVETMRRVRSPFVAEVIDADVTGKHPYIVTRYVAGRTLDSVVRRDGPLPPRALERLASGLAQALAAVHAAGVVHRDLKPGNVMLTDGNPVVIDFGIAHTADASRLTQTGMFMGTPGYLAPEVIEGQPSTEASDVHSWGATVAFAATGRPPFGTGTFESVFFRIVQGQADLDGIPAPLLPLVLAALSRDPRGRPSAAWLCAQSAALDLTSAPPVHGVYLTGAGRGGLVPTMRETAVPPVSTKRLPEPAEALAPGQLAGMLPPVRYAPYPPAPVPPPPVQEPAGDMAAYRTGAAYWTGAWPAEPGVPQDPVRHRPRARPGRLPGLAVMVIAVAVSVMLPIAGMLASLAMITLLRAADRTQAMFAVRRATRRPGRGRAVAGTLGVLVRTPWIVVRSVLTSALLAPAALAVAAIAAVATIIAVRGNPVPLAGAAGAGALVAFYGIGPGSGKPRRQVGRIFGLLTRTRGSSAVTAIVVCALAAAAVVSASSQPPLYWPVHSGMLPHLSHLNSIFHLPRLSVTGAIRQAQVSVRDLLGRPRLPGFTIPHGG